MLQTSATTASLSISEEKKLIRTTYNQRRSLFANESLGSSVFERLKNHWWFEQARSVSIYVSQPIEFPTLGLFEFCLRQKKKVYAPVMQGLELSFKPIVDWNRLHMNEKNIREPLFGSNISPEQIDVFFVPLTAFDRSGNRLGRGGINGGFYDRLFSNHQVRGKKVGLGFEFQEHFRLPTEIHDVPMDYILTERRIIQAL